MVLLDTHVLIWCSLQPERLGLTARQRVEDAWRQRQLAVSAVSFWEVALLLQAGRLTLARTTEEWRREWLRQGLVEIPLPGSIAIRGALLEGMPADVADRWIVATALAHQATLITADQRLLGCSGELLCQDACI
jgi:PIN domain nuclease of toxin-antitoxin system